MTRSPAETSPNATEKAPIELNDVKRREFTAIKQRRRRAFSGSSGDKELCGGLCGLALSGGGIRSGAMSLGFVEALQRRGLIEFVDYLSTVSGGGYAGAYLSSAALANTDLSGQTAEASSPQAVSEHRAAREDGQLAQRILRFIYGGNYLRKTWFFFNRYLIGLLLVWTVLLSGLLAVASAGAIVFRSLDYPIVRTALSALDFDGDFWLAFFPSFILLLAWVAAWTLSYLKFNARAMGATARWLFYILVIVTLIAVAALIGAGDINPASNIGIHVAATGNAFGKTIFTVVISALVAGLLPYLAPKKLLRSGISPRNAAEKYAFWIATRAVAYGIPFVAIAFLTRENISGWNERRDDRLTRTDIVDWSPTNPMWRELISQDMPALQYGRIWPVGEIPDSAKELYHQLNTVLKAYKPAQIDFNEWARINDKRTRARDFLGTSPPPLEAPDAMAPSAQHVVAGLPLEEATSSFFDQWGHFAAFLLHHAVFNAEAARRGQFYADWDARYRPLQIEDRLVYQLNERLKDPKFQETFFPLVADDKSHASIVSPGSNAGKDGQLYREFLVSFSDGNVIHNNSSGISLTSADENRFEKWHDRLLQLAAEARLMRAQSSDLEGASSSNYASPQELQTIVESDRERAVLNVNRRLLAAYFGDRVRDKSIVYSANVLHQDQRTRLRWLLYASGIFLAAAFCMDLNATSLHGFYSTQLGQAWIEPSSPYGRNIPLAQLRTTDVGKPYHLINGTVQLFGKGTGEQALRQEAFLFSQLYCGSESLDYAPTSKYMDGRYALDDAISISGAAITPALSHNPLILVLLWLANLRLGQWVDNPSHCRRNLPESIPAFERWPYTPFRVLTNMFHPPEARRMCFVTDGGHYENLGIEALLLRRCRLIIALDAGQDADYSFADFTRLVRRMRITHGIKIVPWDDATLPLRLDVLSPPECSPGAGQSCADSAEVPEVDNAFSYSDITAAYRRRLSLRHFSVLRIRYVAGDSDQDGCLVYAKSTLTGDEPFDLTEFAKINRCFPHDETADQFFAPDRFESYRQLGFHIGQYVCNYFEPRFQIAAHDLNVDMLIDWNRGRNLAHDQKVHSTLAQLPTGIDDDLKRKLAQIDQLLIENQEDAAWAELEKLLNEESQVLTAIEVVLALMPRFKVRLHNPYAALNDFMWNHPNEAAAALCSVLQNGAIPTSKVIADAITCLVELWHSVPQFGALIVAKLNVYLELTTPAEVVEVTLRALIKIAPQDQVACSKARNLIKQDVRKEVVRLAKRFVKSAKQSEVT